jgi:uncharacterized membrane protein HdeD (DUF308 family)
MSTYAQREDTTITWWLVLLEGILATLFGFLLLIAPLSPLFCARSLPVAIGA